MRLARSVVALAIVLATTTSYMTRTTYAENTPYAEVAATTAVATNFVTPTNSEPEQPLGEFSDSFKDAAKEFITPPAPKPVQQVTYARAAGSTAGNSYAMGTCTWYVKNRVPAWPNAMGNANQWIYSAQGLFNTGNTAAAGAIGVERGAMHVVYVESVSADGRTVTISEMNYAGHPGVHYRTEPVSKFQYIYM